jgi:hypothetical protein
VLLVLDDARVLYTEEAPWSKQIAGTTSPFNVLTVQCGFKLISGLGLDLKIGLVMMDVTVTECWGQYNEDEFEHLLLKTNFCPMQCERRSMLITGMKQLAM